MARRRYTPKLKAQMVLEVLSGEKTPGQVAKAYGGHPNLRDEHHFCNVYVRLVQNYR